MNRSKVMKVLYILWDISANVKALPTFISILLLVSGGQDHYISVNQGICRQESISSKCSVILSWMLDNGFVFVDCTERHLSNYQQRVTPLVKKKIPCSTKDFHCLSLHVAVNIFQTYRWSLILHLNSSKIIIVLNDVFCSLEETIIGCNPKNSFSPDRLSSQEPDVLYTCSLCTQVQMQVYMPSSCLEALFTHNEASCWPSRRLKFCNKGKGGIYAF